MIKLRIKVTGENAVATERRGRLTSGMVGAKARFSFDSVWNDLTKVAVFRCGCVIRDGLEWDGDSVRIPSEVLVSGGQLYAGVEGRNSDGDIVIPTVWAECGTVLEGANASGDPSTDPALPVWAQIQSMIGDLNKLGTVDRSSLVAAINEVLAKAGGGAVDEANVERMVEEYLQEHPAEPGAPGKSAYQYAVDGGYVGTEQEFAAKLAQETKIHVGPEPPEDESNLWLDTGELGEVYVPAPAAAEVGHFLQVTEVDEDGMVAATKTVGTDTSLSVSGAPADALVTGTNIRNIGKTLNSIEKDSRYMTTESWMLSIDSVGKTVTVPSGMLACGSWCLAVPEQTVDILQDDATTLVVYDSSDDAIKSVLFGSYTGKTMYVIAVITRDRYAEPNANWVQGPYLVDGVLVGSLDVASGVPEWKKLRWFTIPADPTTDTSGITWITNDAGGVIGFEIDADADGETFGCSEFSIAMYGSCADYGNISFYAGNTLLLIRNGWQNTGERYAWYTLEQRNGAWRLVGAWHTNLRHTHDFVATHTTGFYPLSVSSITTVSTFGIRGSAAFNAGYCFNIWGR